MTIFPVLDTLGDDVPVSVENSILVYSSDPSTTSVVVCNWFGTGNAGLSDPDADSSVQSYENIYDKNWTEQGNRFIAPGVERVDVILEDGVYTAKKVWTRADVSDTSMIKLSTATGYLYGYWKNMDTGMWCYEVLDFSTGDTVWEVPVSDLPEFNNMAVGMIADVKGNTLYCPTNNMDMVILQDRFVYLPGSPGKHLELSDMERYVAAADMLPGQDAATYLIYATVRNIRSESTIAFKVNGLDRKVSDYQLMCQDREGTLVAYTGSWELCDAVGTRLDGDVQLKAGQIYQIRFRFEDGSAWDLDDSENQVKLSALLAAWTMTV